MRSKININKNWLDYQVNILFLTEREIASKLGISQKPVANRLEEYNLRTPTQDACAIRLAKSMNINPSGIKIFIDKYHSCIKNKINDKAYNIIEGHLLGDGDISFRSPYLSIKSQYISYLKHIASIFNKENIITRPIGINKKQGQVIIHDKLYTQNIVYYLNTIHHSDFDMLHKQWYRKATEKDYNNGLSEKRKYIKIVPEDVKIEKETLLYWYIDDGCLNYRKNRSYGKIVDLASNGFSIKDTNLLKEKLKKMNIEINISSENRIIINKKQSVELFFDFIGPCPPDIFNIYGYKWRKKEEGITKKEWLENKEKGKIST